MSTETILIIEDSSYLAESLIDMLEISGFHPLHAQTGEAGVAMALDETPDLILLDIRLPDISGYEVYQKLRNTDWGKTARVMVLTASESTENIAKNIDLPSEYVLFKPDWSMPALLEKIKERLHKD